MSIKTGAVNPSAGKTKSQNATEVVDPKDLGYDPKKINIGLNAHKVAVRQAREKTLDQISAVDENFAKKRTETTEKIAKHNETIAGNKALIKKMYSNVNKDIASQLAEFDKEKNKYEKNIDKNTRKLKELQDELDTANAGLKALKDTKEWKNRELTETQKTEFDKYSKIIREAENQKTLLYGKFDGKKLTKEEKEAYKTVIKKINGNQNMTFEEKTQTELQEEVNKINKEENKTKAKAKSLMSATDRKSVENKEKGVEKLRKEKVELNNVKYKTEKKAIDATGAAVNLNYEATAAMAHEKAINMFDQERIIRGGASGTWGAIKGKIDHVAYTLGDWATGCNNGEDVALQALEANAKSLNTLAEKGRTTKGGDIKTTTNKNGEEQPVIVDEMTNSMHEYQATNDSKRNAAYESLKIIAMNAPGGNYIAGGIHMLQAEANDKAKQVRNGSTDPTYWSTENGKHIAGDLAVSSTYVFLPKAGKFATGAAKAIGLNGSVPQMFFNGVGWGGLAAGADAFSQYMKTGTVDEDQTWSAFWQTGTMGAIGKGLEIAAANPEHVLNRNVSEVAKDVGTVAKSGIVKTYEGAKGIVNSAKSLPSKVYNRLNNYRLNKTANAIKTAEPVTEQPAANAGTMSEAAATGNTAETAAAAPENTAAKAPTQEPQKTTSSKQTGEQVKAEPAAKPKTAVIKEGITSKDFESYQVGESVYNEGEYLGTVVSKTSTDITLNYKGYTRNIKVNNKGISIEPLKAPETAQVVVEEGAPVPKDLKDGMTVEIKHNGESTYGKVTTINESGIRKYIGIESPDGTVTKIETQLDKIVKQTQKQPQKIREISSQKPEVVLSGEPQVTFKDCKIGDPVKINGKNAKIIEQSEHLTEQKAVCEDGSTYLIKENNLGIKIEPLKAPETVQVVVEEGAPVPKDLKDGMTVEIKHNGESTYGKVTTINESGIRKYIGIESPDGTVTKIETQLDKIVKQTKNSPKAAVEYNEQAAAKTSESAPTQEAQATAQEVQSSRWDSFRNWLDEFLYGPKTTATGNTAEASATAPENTVAPEQNTANVASEAPAAAPENTVAPEQNTATPKQPKETVVSEAQAAKPESTAAAPETKTNTTGTIEKAKEAFIRSAHTSNPDKVALIINEGVRYYRDKQ